MTEEVYLALGTNMGDRDANLKCALELLDAAFGVPHAALSSFYANPAQGFEGEDFLNAVVRYDLSLEPLRILDICKDVERQMGRVGGGIRYDSQGRRIYRSRVIDVDVLLIGDMRVDTPVLTVPHPRMEERDFVMIPLREIYGGIL